MSSCSPRSTSATSLCWRVRRLSPGPRRALVNALLELEESGVAAFGDLDPSEGFYLAYDQRLIEELGLDIGGALHTARSGNDLGATLHRLKTRVQIIKIMDGLLALRGALLDSSVGALDMVMTGYTHHRPAQPVTFGHWLLTIEGALSRDWLRFGQALTRTNEMPLGSCALAKGNFSSTTLLANHWCGSPGWASGKRKTWLPGSSAQPKRAALTAPASTPAY